MSHRQTLPGVWICTNDPSLNYKNHGRKSANHNKIYLKDGEEFEIELFNPMRENVLAIISIDGKQIAKSGIVVRAGQRFYLDCFYDDLKKFVFNTYDVENTSESKEAIAKNGLFEVNFYREKILKKYDAEKIVEIHHHHYPRWNHWYTNGTGSGTLTINNNSGSFLRSSITTDSLNVNNTAFTTTSFSDGTATIGATYNASSNSGDNLTFNSLGLFSQDTSIETGQVDKGANSDQRFTVVDMDFEENILNKIVYTLLPESRRPATNNDFSVKAKKIKLSADEIELDGKVIVNSTDKVSKLLELKGMLVEKLITSSEFEKLKAEILA